jgi:hypothetical protein
MWTVAGSKQPCSILFSISAQERFWIKIIGHMGSCDHLEKEKEKEKSCGACLQFGH